MLSYFGIENHEPDVRLLNKNGTCPNGILAGKYIYPLPSNLAKLVEGINGGKTSYDENFAHPSLLDGVDTKQMLKLLKFKLWADHMVKSASAQNVAEVIKAEANLFETHGFELKDKVPVNFDAYDR